jgi:predicted molibdopterin-dependent oxidoreductase YjgC
MRIHEHPVIDDLPDREEVTIFINNRPVGAREGDTVASALWTLGVRRFRTTRVLHQPRGPFCFIGRCTDCEVTVDGRARVKACITGVIEGMHIDVPGVKA